MMKHTLFVEARKTLWVALPFIANQLLQMSVVTIDSAMAGYDSDLTLAAISQGTTLWHFVTLGIIGLMMPLTALVAKAHARNDKIQLCELFMQSLWLAIPLGLFGFMAMWIMPAVLHIMGVDARIIPPATDYLRIVAFTLPLIALFLPIRFTAEGMGNPAVVMLITATSIPINIIGNYILLNGVWIFPKMGASGIAWATLLSHVYLLFAGCFYVFRHAEMRSLFSLSKPFRPLHYPIVHIIRLGVPNSLALLMEIGMFTTVVLLSGRLGVEVAAANQIALNYISIIFMVPLGISMALTTRIGMAIGADNLQSAREIGSSGIVLGAILMFVSIALIVLGGENIARLYSDNATVVAIASSLLIIAGIFQVFDAVQICAAGALRGMEDTRALMFYSAIGYWVLAVPLAVVLAFVVKMGAIGLWWGLAVGLSSVAIMAVRRFLHITRLTA